MVDVSAIREELARLDPYEAKNIEVCISTLTKLGFWKLVKAAGRSQVMTLWDGLEQAKLLDLIVEQRSLDFHCDILDSLGEKLINEENK